MIETREVSPTEGNGFSTAGIHEMQVDPPPGDKAQAPKVRPYTMEEKGIVRPADNETREARITRLVATQAIDRTRFEEAAVEHPDMAEHFGRLIRLGEESVAAWAQYYVGEHAGADIRPNIPYDGTEPVTQVFEPPAEVIPYRVSIPA